MSILLQEARIKVKRNDECRRQTSRLLRFNTDSMICGYEYSKDACQVRLKFDSDVKFEISK